MTRSTNDARDLIVPAGETLELCGDLTYTRSVQVNGTLTVKPYDGSDASTGSLTLRAPWIIVGPGGRITADGRGFGGGGAGTPYYSTGRAGGQGGTGGKGGAGASASYTYAGGGGGGSNGGAGGTSSYGAGAAGTAASGGSGGTYSSYRGGPGGSGFGGGGGGGCSGSSYCGGGGGGGGSGGMNANERLGGAGAGPAAGAGGQSVSNYYNAVENGQDGGYKLAGGNGDLTTDLSVVKGGGGGGGGASCYYTGGGGGGGAGGGAVMLLSSGNIAVDGTISTIGAGGGSGGYYSTSTSYPGGRGGGGAGGGILLSGLKLTVNGPLDARGRTADALSITNGGTVKLFFDTDGSGSALIQAGRVYRNGRPKMAGLVAPEHEGTGLIRTEFSWLAAKDPETDPVTYHLQVSNAPDFSTLELDVLGIQAKSFTSDRDIVGAAFYWRVRASDAGGFGAWSPVWKFFTDTTPPVSSVNPLPAFTNTANFTVSWSGTDDSSGLAGYDILVSDNSGVHDLWQEAVPGTSGVFHGKDGHSYSFYSTAIDKAANREEAPAGADASTTVDITPPTSRIVSLAPYQSSTQFQLTWSGRDATSGIRCYDVYLATGDSPFDIWEKGLTRSTATFEGIDGTEYSFYTVATDNAGNVEPTPGPEAVARVKIDQSAPSTEVRVGSPSFGQEPVFISPATQISFDCADGFSGVEQTFYKIDERAVLTFRAAIRETVAGPHNMTYWSKDKAGNLETQGSLWFWVDADIPLTSAIFEGPSYQKTSSMYVSAQTTIFLAVEDPTSGVARTEYKLDGGGYQAFGAAFSVTTPGSHNLYYRSFDRVGNAEPEIKMQLIVDATPPTTRVTAPTSSSRETVTVELSAGDDGSGLGTTFFRVVAQGDRPGDFQEGSAVEVVALEDHSLDGNYTIQFYSVDNLGNPERIRDFKVRIDTSASVRLSNPREEFVDTKLYVVQGRTEPGSTVTVNNKNVLLSSDGSFYEEVELQPGTNQVVLTIMDTAGNSITKKISVTYNEPLSQTSWILPLVVAAALAIAVGLLVVRNRKKRRMAALEEPPQAHR